MSKWPEITPQVIYEAYPDHDVLPIEPLKPGETIGEFAYRAENAGDTLFLFLCREANDEIDAQVYIRRHSERTGCVQREPEPRRVRFQSRQAGCDDQARA